METPTPTPTAVERFTIIKEKLRLRLEAEGPRYGITRAVDLLVLELITWMISLAAARAEQRLQEQEACRDDAVAEPGPPGGFAVAGGDSGADCPGVAGGPGPQGRAVVRATGGAPVVDGAAHQDCIAAMVCAQHVDDSRGDGGAWSQRNGPRWPEPSLILSSRSVVLQVRFAKIGLMGGVDFCLFRCYFETSSDCCWGDRELGTAGAPQAYEGPASIG
jgi:hypothetical protein